MSKLRKALRTTRLRIALPFFAYEIQLDDLLDTKSSDERIARLDAIKKDLEDAVLAVQELKKEAKTKKDEVEKLKGTVAKLEKDKDTAQALLKLPEDAFTRVLTRATSKGRVRGVVEGAVIGFITGVLSSFLVWYLTT